MISGLHHSVYRCSDSEQTRKFYEDFLGLPLVNAIHIPQGPGPEDLQALHSFYAMADASCLAFFEAPDLPFVFKPQHDFDLHIALEVAAEELDHWLEKGKQANIETRGIIDHGFVDSVYFRDPDGYVIEVTARRENHNEAMDPDKNEAHAILQQWQKNKNSK